eukprot:scaffold1090_cov265-Pinguiococcus_pyrenoidosus.AAC.20
MDGWGGSLQPRPRQALTFLKPVRKVTPSTRRRYVQAPENDGELAGKRHVTTTPTIATQKAIIMGMCFGDCAPHADSWANAGIQPSKKPFTTGRLVAGPSWSTECCFASRTNVPIPRRRAHAATLKLCQSTTDGDAQHVGDREQSEGAHHRPEKASHLVGLRTLRIGGYSNVHDDRHEDAADGKGPARVAATVAPVEPSMLGSASKGAIQVAC